MKKYLIINRFEFFGARVTLSCALVFALLLFSGQINAAASLEASAPLNVSFYSKASKLSFVYDEDVLTEDSGINIFLESLKEKKFLIDNIGAEGGPPNIVSVFTANADAEKDNELFVIASWDVKHSGLNTAGVYYRVYVYKHDVKKGRVCHFAEVENALGSGLEGVSEGTPARYMYKDAPSIRKHLRKIKYRYSRKEAD